MYENKDQEKSEKPTYAGLNKQTANQFIKISKALIIFFMIYQFALLFLLYKGQQVIAEADEKAIDLIDFLATGDFLIVLVTTAFNARICVYSPFLVYALFGSFVMH